MGMRTSDILQGITTHCYVVLQYGTIRNRCNDVACISTCTACLPHCWEDLHTSSPGLATGNREYSSITSQVKDKLCIPICKGREETTAHR